MSRRGRRAWQREASAPKEAHTLKDNTHVSFSHHLDLGPYLSEEARAKSPSSPAVAKLWVTKLVLIVVRSAVAYGASFIRYCVIKHTGTLMSGHYESYVSCSEDGQEWIHYSDDKATRVTRAEVLKQQACVVCPHVCAYFGYSSMRYRPCMLSCAGPVATLRVTTCSLLLFYRRDVNPRYLLFYQPPAALLETAVSCGLAAPGGGAPMVEVRARAVPPPTLSCCNCMA
jgi:hypothetical protein